MKANLKTCTKVITVITLQSVLPIQTSGGLDLHFIMVLDSKKELESAITLNTLLLHILSYGEIPRWVERPPTSSLM